MVSKLNTGGSDMKPGPTNPLKDARDQLEQAEQLRQKGRLDRAEQICSSLLRRYPQYHAALHTLGLIYADKKNPSRALDPLFRAAMLNPRSWLTLTALSGVCLSLDAKEMAAQILEQARALKPNDPNVLVTLGGIYSEEREYELARDAFQAALTQEPDLEAANLGLAFSFMSLGRNTEAAEILNNLLKRGVRSDRLFAALAELPPTMNAANALSELGKLTVREGGNRLDFENSIAFMRSTALDVAGRYREAWEELEGANRNRFEHVRKLLKDSNERQRFSLKWLRESRAGKGRDQKGATASLFILGPSRSGKSSLEMLLGTIDGVRLGYENPSLENAIVHSFHDAGLITSWSLEHLPPQFHGQFRKKYTEELEHRAGSARIFTNTHPAYIQNAANLIGLIPNVRFIFVKRNVDDLMLRIYMRRYRAGNPFAYSLPTIRDHIDWYFAMMDLMAEKFPDAVWITNYEDMVSDPAGVLRTAAEFCGLPAHEGPVPDIGDDRGCAAPYRELMDRAFEQAGGT